MEISEFEEKLKALKDEFEINESNLCKEFAFSNNHYKVDDIIKDNIGSIKITSIKFRKPSFFNKYPECVYFGIELKKDLTLPKRETRRQISSSSVIK